MNYVERGVSKRRTQIAITHRTRQASWRSTRGSGMSPLSHRALGKCCLSCCSQVGGSEDNPSWVCIFRKALGGI